MMREKTFCYLYQSDTTERGLETFHFFLFILFYSIFGGFTFQYKTISNLLTLKYIQFIVFMI